MNNVHIMLNHRKRFVFLAAMVAVLVLLAGGANALAGIGYRVRCVPNLSVNPSCAVAYPTIGGPGGAVTAANPFDIIFVGPGTYNESVTIGVNSISLFGAQAGNDAREDRHNSNKESIVNAGGTGSAFTVNANYVVIDGFTAEGGTPAGIYVSPSFLGPQFLNNIFQNNSTGVFLNYGTSTLFGADIERNLFRNNNLDPAPIAGLGIISMGTSSISAVGLVITENEFCGNKAAAILVEYAQGATITENTSDNDGSFVVFAATAGSQFSHNQGKKFGHAGVLSVLGSAADAAVDIGPGNEALEISYNDLEDGKAPISNGIAFTTAFGSGLSNLLNVINNKIKRFPDYGIVAEDTPSGGTLYHSSIIGNEVYDNGGGGIFIEGTLAYNYGNDLFDNDAEGNSNYDCEDGTNGGFGTLGTSDYWFNNIGSSSSPTGLCTPGRRHDHD